MTTTLYMLADFSVCDKARHVSQQLYRDTSKSRRIGFINTTAQASVSGDCTAHEYTENIRHAKQVPAKCRKHDI
jgi:hypothetical protein